MKSYKQFLSEEKDKLEVKKKADEVKTYDGEDNDKEE